MRLFDTRAAGLLSAGDLEPAPGFPEDRVDFAQVMGWKLPLLARAADRFLAAARGVRLFGDLPVFVAPDSADVWAGSSRASRRYCGPEA